MNKRQLNILERSLGLVAEIRPGEGTTAILLTLNLFIILTAYLMIKTVREPLILTQGGAAVKSYAAAGQALLFLVVVPAYGFIASRVNRIRLITWVTTFFITNLLCFYALAHFHVPIGIVFFLWVGIFNLLVVAQFWSFANDIYTQEQGQRLFAIVAFGGSLGAILGPIVAGWLIRPLGTYQLMLIAAGLLAISIILAKLVNAREKRLLNSAVRTADTEKPVGQADGFGLVMRQRYLLLIALLMVVANLVNTTGEYILGKKVTDEAQLVIADEERRTITEALGSSLTSAQREKVAQVFLGEFYGNFFFWVSLCEALIQLFLVSRIFKYFGLAGALYFLPLIALGSYSLIAVIPVLSYIRIAKITEKSVDYSVQNTARQTLFLPTSREVKYKAKAAIDTFFVRFGDVLAAVLVFGGVTFAFSISAFALVNIFITGLWLLLAMGIVREHRKLLGAPTRAGGIESMQNSRTMMKEDIRLRTRSENVIK